MPFYTELKGASVSRNAAEQKPGGKLYLTSSFEGDGNNINEQQLLPEVAQLGDLGKEQQLANANASVAPTVNEDLEGTIIDVVNINAVQQGESNSIDGRNSSKANAFQTTKGKVLVGVFGGLLLVALMALFYYLFRNRYLSLNRRGLDDKDDDDFDLRLAKETVTVVSIGDDYQDSVDEEITNPRRRQTQNSTTSSSSSINNNDPATRTRTSGTTSSFSSMEDDQDLEMRKQNSIAVQELNGKALALIEGFDNKHGKDVYELEDAKLLPVTTLRVLCHWKLQKKVNGKKDYLLNLWMQVKKNPPPPSSWSDAEETLMKKLKEDDIQLKETALGRARSKLQEQSVAYFISMSEEERIASNLPVELLDGLKGAVAEI